MDWALLGVRMIPNRLSTGEPILRTRRRALNPAVVLGGAGLSGGRRATRSAPQLTQRLRPGRFRDACDDSRDPLAATYVVPAGTH